MAGELVKTVTLRILADAGDAQAKLDEITAKADALGADTIRVNVKVDAPDLAALETKLAATRAMLADKGLTEAGIRIRVDGAGQAIAELTAVKRAEDDLGGAGGGGILSKLGGLFGGLLGKFPGGAIGPIPLAGGVPGVAAIAAIVAAAAAALPVVASLVSGFVAAGAGAVAFGAMAYPAVTSVTSAYSALNTAQTNYANAQALYKVSPTAANLQAMQQAAAAVKAAQLQVTQLGPAAAAAVTGLQKLMNAGSNIAQAFQPTVFKIFDEALKVATDLLPAAVPLASAFANALSPLLMQLDRFAQSKGFQEWIQQFSKLIGPAVTAIGQGAGQIAIAFGKILTAVSPKDVGTAIHVLADVIVGALKVIPPAIDFVIAAWHVLQSAGESVARYLVSVWHTFETGVAADLNAAATVVHAVEAAWQSLVSSAEGVYHGVMAAWEAMIHGIVSGGDAVVSFLAGLPGRIESIFADAGSWLVSAGRAILQGLLSGLESMAGSVISFAEHIGQSILSALGGLFHFGSPSRTMITLGRWIGEGLAIGMGDSVPVLLAASRQMGYAATGGLATAGGGYGGGSSSSTVNLHFHGVTTDPNTVRQLVQALAEYKRHGGGAPLGIA